METNELEEKIGYLKKSLESYKKELSHLNEFKIEAKILQAVSLAIVSSKSFDDLFKKTMEILAVYLKARYYGVFWLDDERNMFEYRYGKGYKTMIMSAIPRVGSLMGECLHTHDIVWVADLRVRTEYIPLNQDPAEYNVLCAPIVLLGIDCGVVRFANIDTVSLETSKKLFATVYPLLCASLERMQLQEKNKQALRGFEASYAIARLLENTLVEFDILKQVCFEVPRLFNCKAVIIALCTDSGVRPAFCWPEDFFLGGNPHSNGIYLRNLLEAFPQGNALIEDIHKDRRWAWPARDIRSLCMYGLHVKRVLKGFVLVLGPGNEVYSSTQQNLLGLVATQTSITLERASYFRKQEELASSDGLTGLLNHRMFQDNVRAEIERVKRYNRVLSLVMFDIDHFKKFNDTYGHQIGDEVLVMVARTTKGLIRNTDRAFRYGGEEFCILLPETAMENALICADRLRQKVESNKAVHNLTVTISLGLTEYKPDESPELFIKRADSLLYSSKEGGRNRVSKG
jgi:diguanylate cyclase (GGDEF)-like protein